jgi:hypothetical protein
VSERLATIAAKPGASKTAIMTDALQAYFDRRAANDLDERFKARLDKLSIELARIERDQQIVAESIEDVLSLATASANPEPQQSQMGLGITVPSTNTR